MCVILHYICNNNWRFENISVMRRIHGVRYIQNYDYKLHGEKVMLVPCASHSCQY
jgi:hypothetical protein